MGKALGEFVIVPILTLFPDDSDEQWVRDFFRAFCDLSQGLEEVGVYVITNYWYILTPQEMKWCVECLGS
jgi:hypothetical protein